MEVMEHDAAKSVREDGHAYGGFIRMAKGKVQEYVSEQIVRVAWTVELAKPIERLAINSDKIRVPIKRSYIENIRDEGIKKYIITLVSNC